MISYQWYLIDARSFLEVFHNVTTKVIRGDKTGCGSSMEVKGNSIKWRNIRVFQCAPKPGFSEEALNDGGKYELWLCAIKVSILLYIGLVPQCWSRSLSGPLLRPAKLKMKIIKCRKYEANVRTSAMSESFLAHAAFHISANPP
jgi:hypothetical protein